VTARQTVLRDTQHEASAKERRRFTCVATYCPFRAGGSPACAPRHGWPAGGASSEFDARLGHRAGQRPGRGQTGPGLRHCAHLVPVARRRVAFTGQHRVPTSPTLIEAACPDCAPIRSKCSSISGVNSAASSGQALRRSIAECEPKSVGASSPPTPGTFRLEVRRASQSRPDGHRDDTGVSARRDL